MLIVENIQTNLTTIRDRVISEVVPKLTEFIDPILYQLVFYCVWLEAAGEKLVEHDIQKLLTGAPLPPLER